MSNMLGKAIAYAAQGHIDQTDKGGNAYILHPLRLMMRLRTDDEELMQIAVLHDLVEDTTYSFSELERAGFSERVLAALNLLTHNHDDSYEDYIEQIATNIDAIKVKMEDLKDNSDITRLKGISDKDLLRTRKYHRAYVYLQQKLLEHLTK